MFGCGGPHGYCGHQNMLHRIAFRCGAQRSPAGHLTRVGFSARRAADKFAPARLRSTPRAREGAGRAVLVPHNVPFTLLGAGLLWFGWFGFNAGSALAANNIAGLAFVTTMFAPAMAHAPAMVDRSRG